MFYKYGIEKEKRKKFCCMRILMQIENFVPVGVLGARYNQYYFADQNYHFLLGTQYCRAEYLISSAPAGFC